jgi:hypothetical protein
MQTLLTILEFLAVWTALSIPAAHIAANFIACGAGRECEECEETNLRRKPIL